MCALVPKISLPIEGAKVGPGQGGVRWKTIPNKLPDRVNG
jgi:hypothetical protein